MDLSITVIPNSYNLSSGLGVSEKRALELIDEMGKAFSRVEASPGQTSLDKLIEVPASLCKTPGELFWLAARIGQFSQIHGIKL